MGENNPATDLQASVEYLRGYNPSRDGTSFDFLTHIANVARAYLAECDPTPLTIEDVERMLGVKRGEGSLTVTSHEVSESGGRRYEFSFGNSGCTVGELDDGVLLLMQIWTIGEFRTFCRLFRIEVKG